MCDAALISIELGGGNHFFLALSLTLQKYTTIIGQIFTPYINLGIFLTFL